MKKFKEKILSIPDKRIVLFLFLATLIFRAIYAILFFYSNPLPEKNLYYELGIEIINQGKILYGTSDPYYEFPGPVLPWLSAFTMLLFGKNYLVLYLVTALGSALITLYTFKLARLFLNKGVSILIGLWSLIYPFYFYYTPSPGKDIWMAFFMIYLIYMIIKLFEIQNFKYKEYIIFIILFSISFHLDERYFIFTPFIFLYIFLKETAFLKKRKLLKSVIFVVLTLLTMIPWTVRNYNKHGKIVILSTRTEKYTDKLFGYESKEHMLDKYNNVFGAFYIHDYQIDSVKQGLKTETDGGWKISKAQVEAMNRGLTPRPLTGINAFWSRLTTMFEPFQLKERFERTGYFYYKKSLKNNLITFLSYGILLIFSIPGLYYLYRNNKNIFVIFCSILFIYAMINVLLIPYTNWRYRLPLDSIFIILGILGITKIFNRFLIKKKVQS